MEALHICCRRVDVPRLSHEQWLPGGASVRMQLPVRKWVPARVTLSKPARLPVIQVAGDRYVGWLRIPDYMHYCELFLASLTVIALTKHSLPLRNNDFQKLFN